MAFKGPFHLKQFCDILITVARRLKLVWEPQVGAVLGEALLCRMG